MKRITQPNMRTPLAIRILRWSFCITVIAAIFGGLFIAGSPAKRRREALDEQRITNLQSISYAVDAYYQTAQKTLPPDLATLVRNQPHLTTQVTDPKTGASYTYRVRSGTDPIYELCATFETETDRSQNAPRPYGDLIDWTHPIGEKCFELRVRTPDPIVPQPSSASPKPL